MKRWFEVGFVFSGTGLTIIARAILGAALGVQTYRLNSCQAELAGAQAQVVVMGAQIKEQNRAVEALQAAGAKKQAESAAALRKAEGRARVWDEQAKRLSAALTSRKPDGPKDCTAAWAEIRKP